MLHRLLWSYLVTICQHQESVIGTHRPHSFLTLSDQSFSFNFRHNAETVSEVGTERFGLCWTVVPSKLEESTVGTALWHLQEDNLRMGDD